MVRVDLLTREYPPHVYGGAGVHVAELAAVLRARMDVRVHCFDGPRGEPGVSGYDIPSGIGEANAAVNTFGVDLAMVAGIGRESGLTPGDPSSVDTHSSTDLVHSHTWYANLAGHLASLLYGVPHVLSAHSLEPLRPWKAEQLGGGYALSSWAERTAMESADGIIAVSGGMRADILRCYPQIDPQKVHVVHNGIDLSGWHRPEGETETARAHELARANGVDPDRPAVVFVGRITRQKGLPYLLRAAEHLPAGTQLVLCAGAPDTPELLAEVTDLVDGLRQQRGDGVVWIDRMLPRDELVAVLAASTLFVCPSVYEPLGIVNLEAMAVGLPVVATATGGIPEVVDDGVTGWLVPIEQVDDGTGTPLDPDVFVADLTARLLEALADPAEVSRRGVASRMRVEEHFSWEAIADRTMEIYRKVLAGH